MSAAIGITNLWSLTAPASCVVNESTHEDTVQTKTVKDQTGKTVQAGILPMVSTKISLKGKGLVTLTVTAQASFTSGTAYITSITLDETNDDYPSFSLEAEAYA